MPTDTGAGAGDSAQAEELQAEEAPGGILRDPLLYIGIFFAILILGQGAFYAVAFQQPSDALPPHEMPGAAAEPAHGSP